MSDSKKKHKGKKMLVALSQSDYSVLKHLASKEQCCCSTMLKRLIHSRLKELKQECASEAMSKQLELFDYSKQMTLFDMIEAETEMPTVAEMEAQTETDD